MEVHVLGAGRDVGRSCMLLRAGPSRVLLDCGAHPAYADERRFPDFAALGISLSSLDAVLISHFHLDHAAALPLLTEKLRCPAPVYMTAPTLQLARLMLHDFLTTSAARNQYCPFDAHDVRACLARVRTLALGETARVGPRGAVAVTPYYAGHVLGAVMLHVVAAGASVLYSGDYSTRSDRHLKPASVPYGLRPHLFITEATYCSTVRKEGRKEQEDAVMKAVTRCVASGGKVLVPISAFGRVQAVCATFEAHPDNSLLRDVPIYIVSGLASKANDAYSLFRDWTVQGLDDCAGCGNEHEVNNGDIPTGPAKTGAFISRLRPFNRNEHWHLLQRRGAMILFATPGTMSTGLSRDVFKLWARDAKNVVVVPGVNFSNTMTSNASSGQYGDDEWGHEVRCQLVNLVFNSHADARGLVRMCRTVMARSIMLVHGEESKVLAFQKQLNEALPVDCYAPKNGEKVDIPCLRASSPSYTAQKTPQANESLPLEWRSLIEAYLKRLPRDQTTSPT